MSKFFHINSLSPGGLSQSFMIALRKSGAPAALRYTGVLGTSCAPRAGRAGALLHCVSGASVMAGLFARFPSTVIVLLLLGAEYEAAAAADPNTCQPRSKHPFMPIYHIIGNVRSVDPPHISGTDARVKLPAAAANLAFSAERAGAKLSYLQSLGCQLTHSAYSNEWGFSSASSHSGIYGRKH